MFGSIYNSSSMDETALFESANSMLPAIILIHSASDLHVGFYKK